MDIVLTDAEAPPGTIVEAHCPLCDHYCSARTMRGAKEAAADHLDAVHPGSSGTWGFYHVWFEPTVTERETTQ